jgi:hypothetical protein
MLTFGYNRGLPHGATTAWGCRAIVDPNGHLDVPPDRQAATGPRVNQLLEHLNAIVRGAWRDRAHELIVRGVMHPRHDGEFVLFQNNTVVIKGNTQRSGGYLYVCAYFRDEETTPQPHAHQPQCQTFTFLTHRWCVTHALDLIHADPTAAHLDTRMDISRLAPYLQMIKIDPDHAATVDLTTPILIAPILTHDDEELGHLAIDGWHRIHRAVTEHTTHLPAYILSPHTAQAVRTDLPARPH